MDFFLLLLGTGAFLYIYYRVGKVNHGRLLPVFFMRKRARLRLTNFLSKNPYFKNLSPSGKEKFIVRTQLFRERITYVAMHGLELTEEMEVSIAACAVQLTFGLDEFLFDHFRHIYVYPKAFYVQALNAELRGGVSPRGNIYLSWKNFKEGNDNASDGINLGLHEMAHALKISAVLGDFDDDFIEELQQWVSSSEEWLKDLPPQFIIFLREYGFTNSHEFFSVCVEHFFEQPQEFSGKLPAVYHRLKELLNQDPLNIKGDYALSTKPVAGAFAIN